MNWKYFIGIDVSKATLDVCILEGKDKRHSIEIENKPKALTAFWKLVSKQIPGFIHQCSVLYGTHRYL